MMYQHWGKAGFIDRDSLKVHLLVYHGFDVAAVGEILLRSNPILWEKFSSWLSLEKETFLRLICFLLAIHDVGKFSSGFQNLNEALAKQLGSASDPRYKYKCHHTHLGYKLFALNDQKQSARPFLEQLQYAAAWEKWDILLYAVMGHHGQPAKEVSLCSEKLGDYFSQSDIAAANEFICAAQAFFLKGLDPVGLMQNLDCKALKAISFWLAGFVILCDWLASDESYFEFVQAPMLLERYWQEYALVNAKKAFEASGLFKGKVKPFESSRALFPYIEKPTPLQDFCQTCELSDHPQLWILEDLTGAGKTEAAMVLAHRLMGALKKTGVFVALPTTATSNAMYERMAHVYKSFYEQNTQASLVLAHGSRHLSDLFNDSILSRSEGTRGDWGNKEEGLAVCTQWIASHHKKALLADSGVGTIDQVLLSVLPAMHQSLRLLGLLNKILIVDEVHAYDSYVNAFLKGVLQFHGASGGSVILLSATLPSKLKLDLINAFGKGTGRAYSKDPVEISHAYPLATCCSDGRVVSTPIETRASVCRTIEIAWLDERCAPYEKIQTSILKGGCVCWIRNTVKDAIEAYERLCDVMPKKDLMLFHSRFAMADRLSIERDVLRYFGKTSTQAERQGKVLIATQVVEQSLDLDFDTLISDLAPIDLLIQRAGRLQRHQRDRMGCLLVQGEDERKPVLYIFGPPNVEVPPSDWYSSFLPRAARVYANPGCLWLTDRVLRKFKNISLPQDARYLIESVYGEDQVDCIPENLRQAADKAQGDELGKSGAGHFNKLNFKTGFHKKAGIWDAEIKIPTRFSDQVYYEVYLAKQCDGALYPWAQGPHCWDMSAVKIPGYLFESLSDIAVKQEVLDALKKTGDFDNDRVQYLLPMQLDGRGSWRCLRHASLYYFEDKGLVEKK